MSPGIPAVRGDSPAVTRSQPLHGPVRGRLRCQAYLGDLRVRALRGPDAAEASPRRCASWRSRGRRWRGPSARATERPCRISAEQTGLLTAARPRVPGATARGQAMATGDSAWPAAGSASESGTASTLGQTAAAMTRPGHCDACANELSTRAGENNAQRWANCCGSGGLGSLPIAEAPQGCTPPHTAPCLRHTRGSHGAP